MENREIEEATITVNINCQTEQRKFFNLNSIRLWFDHNHLSCFVLHIFVGFFTIFHQIIIWSLAKTSILSVKLGVNKTSKFYNLSNDSWETLNFLAVGWIIFFSSTRKEMTGFIFCLLLSWSRGHHFMGWHSGYKAAKWGGRGAGRGGVNNWR